MSSNIIVLLIMLGGIYWYYRTYSQMKQEQIKNAPVMPLFAMTISYICLLVTTFLGFKGGFSFLQAVVGFWAAGIAPWLAIYLAIRFYKKKDFSKYHGMLFWMSALYCGGLILMMLLLMVTGNWN